jgi:hypothetical protein
MKTKGRIKQANLKKNGIERSKDSLPATEVPFSIDNLKSKLIILALERGLIYLYKIP